MGPFSLLESRPGLPFLELDPSMLQPGILQPSRLEGVAYWGSSPLCEPEADLPLLATSQSLGTLRPVPPCVALK